jgi:hypothetical protein
MINRINRFILMVIMLTPFLAGVSAGCNTNEVNNGENNMTTTAPRIPLIDVIAPANTETATFALG